MQVDGVEHASDGVRAWRVSADPLAQPTSLPASLERVQAAEPRRHSDVCRANDARCVELGTTPRICAAVELLAQTPDLAGVCEQPAKDGYLLLRAALSAAIFAQWASETASTFCHRDW